MKNNFLLKTINNNNLRNIIGKTTIMLNLNNNKDIAQMFDIVIWIAISKDSIVEKLQQTIIDRLKLDVKDTTNPDEISRRISIELECKRCLLLLDEVLDKLDLCRIGIHENQKDSKVVLATRYRDICFAMETEELINVKRISEVDAWKIFTERVGQNVNLPCIEPIAKLVVRECAGLPLLIDKVASTFRTKDNIHLWWDGLMSLQRWPSIKDQGMDELSEFLKFCYDDLNGEEFSVWCIIS
jgi:disease resistance protein RPS2